MMLDVVLLILLLAAVIIGYFLGRWNAQRNSVANQSRFDKDYIVGLNYLLSEQTDKAVDTLMQALKFELDENTFDTYIALGTFFCKRGEVENSIQIHQDLLARTNLTKEQAERVQIALAQDYMAAGLLDRAESMLTKLVSDCSFYKENALTELLCIYELEHEWEKALQIGSSLKSENKDYSLMLAQYHCEIAEQHIRRNNLYHARKSVKQALYKDKRCVRAGLLLAKIETNEENYKEAIRVLERTFKQSRRYVPILIPQMEQIYMKTNNISGFVTFMSRCLQEYPTTAAILAMTRFIRYKEGEDNAINFLFDELQEHPTLKGVNTLLFLQLETGSAMNANRVRLLMDLTSKIIKIKALFKCSTCGFKTQDMYWKCPRCKQWGSLSPIEGLEGE